MSIATSHSPLRFSFRKKPSAVSTAARVGCQLAAEPIPMQAKWSWGTRSLVDTSSWVCSEPDGPPRSGDVVVVRVVEPRNHSGVVVQAGERQRIYAGDVIVGIMGSRYATDAFEGEAASWDDLHMLTNGGMIGTVRSRHADLKPPTQVELIGVVRDAGGERLNLKERLFQPRPTEQAGDAGDPAAELDDGLPTNVVISVGAGMNAGKTTSTARLARELVSRGRRVAVLKVTGSVSSGDLREFRATGAAFARDFSDYGFPSTYRCDADEVIGLFERMLADAAEVEPDAILVEIADGVLQQETQALLGSHVSRRCAAGVLLAAGCAPAALTLEAEIRRLGHEPVALTGIITNSPLFVREFRERSSVPVLQAIPDAVVLADYVEAVLVGR